MALHPSTQVRYAKATQDLDVQPLSYLTELYQAISKPIVFTSYAAIPDPQEANAIDVGVKAITSTLLLVRFTNGCEVLCDNAQLWAILPEFSRKTPIYISPINGYRYIQSGRLLIGDRVLATNALGYVQVSSVENYPVTYTEVLGAKVPLFGNFYVMLSATDGTQVPVVAGHHVD